MCGRYVRRGSRRGLSGAGHAGKVDGPDLVDQVVVGHRNAVGVEGVGRDDVRPGLQVAAVDAGDGLGLGDRQQVVAALEVAMVGGELRAAVVGLAELELLDHGAHRAVEDGDASGEEFAKLGKWRVEGISFMVEFYTVSVGISSLENPVPRPMATWRPSLPRRPRGHFVDVPDTPENREFFVAFKDRVKSRFKQIEVWMTTCPIEVL